MDVEPPMKRRRTSSSRSSSPGYTPNHSSLPYRRADSPSDQRDRRETRSPPSDTSRSTTSRSTASPSPIPPPKANHLGFKPFHTIPKAHARGITSLKFSPDGSLLATSSADATINVYAVPSTVIGDGTVQPEFKLLKTLRGHAAGINALAWSPRGPPHTLASASDDKSILLWQPLSSDTPIAPSPLLGHHNYVYSLAFSPKGNMLVSGSYDEAVFLWDVRAGRVMRSLPAHSDPVRGVDFLPGDGTMLASCASDGLIRIWDAGTGQCLRTLVDEDRKAVTSVRFSPNGRFVLAWTLDGCIRLWRYIEGKGACVKTYQGHLNRQHSLGGTMGSYGVARNETFVVSGSEDGVLLVWDVSTKEVLWRVTGHRAPVLGVDFVRLGGGRGRGLMVSGGLDRDVRIWLEDVDENEHEDNIPSERPGMETLSVTGFKTEDSDDEMVTEQLMHDMAAGHSADAVDTPEEEEDDAET